MAAGNGEVKPWPAAGIRTVVCRREGRECRDRIAPQVRSPARRIQVHPLRRHRPVGFGDVGEAAALQALAGGIVLGDQIEAAFENGIHLIVEDNHRTAQVVEQRVERSMEQGQPMLHAGVVAAFGDRRVEEIIAGDGTEQRAISRAEAGNRCIIEKHFAHWLDRARRTAPGRALGCGIEKANRLDLIAEKIQPQGLARAGRKQIDDAAADGEIATFRNRFSPRVAVPAEVARERGRITAAAFLEREDRSGKRAARRQALDDRSGTGQDDRRLAARLRILQVQQRFQAAANDIGAR